MPAKLDDKAMRVLAAIKNRCRPYLTRDVCMASHYSKSVVEKRIDRLKEAGLINEVWKGERGPFWEVPKVDPKST